jgi:lysophospholipase L1-like esterase
MRRTFLLAAFGLVLCAGPVPAFDVLGIIKKVDAEKGTLYVHAGGKDRTVKIARDARILGNDGKPLADGLKSPELKEGAEVTLTVEPADGEPVIKAIRLGKHVGGEPPPGGKASVGLKPLNEMAASDRYKGEDGGLYGGGKNEPPEAHLSAARKESAKVVPLDEAGKPAADGKIGLVSISMSNATQEFSLFKELADRSPQKSPRVAVVDCAQGGQAMAEWVDPRGGPWAEADRRLMRAGVSPNQVQIVWVKLANKGPSGDLAEHGKKLQKDTLAVLQNAKARFPNLRIAYLSSRIYGGWSGGRLNPEPYAYEGAFAVRWLIQDQIKGAADLNYDPERGAVKAPLLLWGPYLWADGSTARKSDGLVWERQDLAGDGTHPSESGRRKVADMLLKFFSTDPLASAWFVKEGPAEKKIELKKGDRIIFLGDSLTELAGKEEPKNQVSKGYVRIVREELEKAHKDKNVEVDWVATGGHTVPDLLKRVEKDVIAKKPTIVFIQIGCNDARRIPAEQFKAGLEELIDRLQKADIQVVQCTLTSVGEKHDGSNKDDAKLEQFAEIARGVAAARKVPLNDLRKAFVEHWKQNNPDNKPSGVLTYDGNHFNQKGHDFVAAQMLKMLK